jgi:hypothetical protein
VGTVAHACHHKLHRRLRSGGSWFQARLVKKADESHLNRKQLGVVVHTYHPGGSRKTTVQAGMGKNRDLVSKITRVNRSGGVDHTVEQLPSKYKALGITKEERKEGRREGGKEGKRERKRERKKEEEKSRERVRITEAGSEPCGGCPVDSA